MAVLRDGRFWVGVIVGYLLLVFVPQLNFRNMGKRSGGQ